MGLKEKVIEMLRNNPERLNMSYWGFEEEAVLLDQNSGEVCGTTMCLAGHICVAANGELPEYGPISPENYWNSKGDHPEDLARTIWAKEYGEDSARVLEFYKFNWTAEDVINHLEEITK